MRRFFYYPPNLLAIGKTLAVTDDIFLHWCKVLRANMGDTAIFFDGQGGEYTVTLCQIGKKTADVMVTDFNPINRNLPYTVNIGLVMSRGERMDYAIQKATEMGVTSIQLLVSERCEVRLKSEQISKKIAHWQGVAIAACEQCGLNIMPKILPPIDLSDFLLPVNRQFDILPTINNQTGIGYFLNLVLAVPDSTTSSNDILSQIKQCLSTGCPTFNLLIGAEGGLSELELQQAQHANFLPWQIGERVLRTETAPVVALATLQAIRQSLLI